MHNKVLEAFKRLKKPVIVEDTSLCLHGLGDFPGPYVKQFLGSMGIDNIAKVTSSIGNTGAHAQTIFALHHGNKPKSDKIKTFLGRIDGTIVPPRGSSTFGFDPIFLPKDHQKTFGEMTMEEKN